MMTRSGRQGLERPSDVYAYGGRALHSEIGMMISHHHSESNVKCDSCRDVDGPRVEIGDQLIERCHEVSPTSVMTPTFLVSLLANPTTSARPSRIPQHIW